MQSTGQTPTHSWLTSSMQASVMTYATILTPPSAKRQARDAGGPATVTLLPETTRSHESTSLGGPDLLRPDCASCGSFPAFPPRRRGPLVLTCSHPFVRRSTMPLIPHDSATPVEMFPGVVRRTLTFGERLMLVEVTLDDGAVVPMHTHPHEQTGYLVSGRFLFELGGERRELGPGRSEERRVGKECRSRGSPDH